MSTGEPEKLANIKILKINYVQVTLEEALNILKERTFKLNNIETFNLVDKISEYIYPTEVDH